jgi:hypothetical protein
LLAFTGLALISALSRWKKIVLAFIPLIILAVVLFLSLLNPVPPVTPLAVTFAGWATDPVSSAFPPRLVAGRGATGVCALFWVTNSGPRNKTLWFNTVGVEQKIDGQWHPFPLAAQPWQGPEGHVWFGGYGCLFAVGWPPGLPTNATWRLQVRCGPDPSLREMGFREMLGLHAELRTHDDHEVHNLLPTSEVVP